MHPEYVHLLDQLLTLSCLMDPRIVELANRLLFSHSSCRPSPRPTQRWHKSWWPAKCASLAKQLYIGELREGRSYTEEVQCTFKMFSSITKTWLQNDFNPGERSTDQKGFSIRTEGVTGLLGMHCTKNGGEGGEEGAGEEKRWLASKNKGFGGLFIGAGVWDTPFSRAFINGLTSDLRVIHSIISSLIATWTPLHPYSLFRLAFKSEIHLEVSVSRDSIGHLPVCCHLLVNLELHNCKLDPSNSRSPCTLRLFGLGIVLMESRAPHQSYG